MTAVLIPTSSEAEWLAARRQGITASEIAIVMGLSPWDSPYALYHRKRGQLPEHEIDDAMGLGTYMEDYVAQRFRDLREDFYVMGDGRDLFARDDRPWQMATPDRLVFDRPAVTAPFDYGLGVPGWIDATTGYSVEPAAVLECKIDGGSDGWGDDGSDQIPVHYRCQVLWQMDVLGVQTGFVACLLWHRRKVQVYEIEMDAPARADLELMRTEALKFQSRLVKHDPPDVDWRPATRDALKHLHPTLTGEDVRVPRALGARWLAAAQAVKVAERRKALAENQIRKRLGTARRAVIPGQNGALVAVARRDVYDLAEKQITRKATTVDRLIAVTPKEPRP